MFNQHKNIKQLNKNGGTKIAIQKNRTKKRQDQYYIDQQTRHAINDYVNNYHLLIK